MNVSVFVYILTVLFGTISYLNYTALWAETPILVQKLPEYWNLPSYTSVSIRIGMVASWVYFIIYIKKPSIAGAGKGGIMAIIALYLVFLISATLTIILWDETSVIFGELHSTAFLCLALVTGICTFCGSLVFLSYMVCLPTAYIPAYHTGEGLSGLLTSIAVIIQGPGQYDCTNTTMILESDNVTLIFTAPNNGTKLDTRVIYKEPLYSIEAYFSFALVLVVLSFLAFLLLNFLPYCKQKHVNVVKKEKGATEPLPCENCNNNDILQDNNKNNRSMISFETHTDNLNSTRNETGLKNFNNFVNANESCQKDTVGISESTGTLIKIGENINPIKRISTAVYVWLIFLNTLVYSILYGACFPIQPYSAQPYGTTVYNLVTQSSLTAYPLGAFLATFINTRSVAVISILAFINLCSAAYIVVLASMSPSPPLVTAIPELGGTLAVTAWAILSGTFGYTRTLISGIIRERGERAMMWLAITGVTGPFLLMVPFFLSINVYKLFMDAPPCSSIYGE